MPITPQSITRAVKLSRKLQHELDRAERVVDPDDLLALREAAQALHRHLLALQAESK